MSRLARFAGFIWAAPLTLLGLAYVAVLSVLGWYRWTGPRGDALVWNVVPERAPKWLNDLWRRWGGHCIGNVVVLKHPVDSDKGKVLLRHEQEHVFQCMVWGIFQPVLYSLAGLALLACRNAHPYYDNPFEIDARRAAGQVVDVIGALKQAIAQGKIQIPVKKA